MDLELSEDQQFFRETTRKFLEQESPLTAVRGLADDPAGFDREWWRQGAQLGWTSMLVPEADGGGSLSGGGLLDLVIVAEEMGRLVAPGPFGPTNVVAAAVAAGGSAEQRARVLPGIVAGELVAAVCAPSPALEPGSERDLVEATRVGDEFVLDGRYAPVEAGAQADELLLTAHTSVDGHDGLTQFLVPADAHGITIMPMGSLDLVRRYAVVQLDAVRLPASAVVGAVGGAAGAVERQLHLAIVLQGAETLGAVDRVFELTLEYMGDRYSFGRPLASYQALKHRIADMKMWIEAAHGVTTAAARAAQDDTPDAAELVSAVKSYVGDHATEIVQECVQFHGGIGVTWEHDLHLYLRRVTVNRNSLGTPADHRERIAVLLAATSPEGEQ